MIDTWVVISLLLFVALLWSLLHKKTLRPDVRPTEHDCAKEESEELHTTEHDCAKEESEELHTTEHDCAKEESEELHTTEHDSCTGKARFAKLIPTWLKEPIDRLKEYFTIATAPASRIITKEFMNVVNAIKSGEQVILVTGGAGTGKTTLIEYLIEQNLADIVVAFTGAAALNCHGKTIHSLFSLPFNLIFPDSVLGNVSRETESIVCNSHIVVIDEISMVRADLLDAVDKRLRIIRQNELPFGGLQMLLVGDPFQLPPVVTGVESPFFRIDRPEHLWISPWFFDAHVFKNCKITHYALTEVFRQEAGEKEYVKFLNMARRCKNLDAVISYFNHNCFTGNNYRDMVTLTADNKTAQQRNKNELNKLPGVVFTSTASCDGAFVKMLPDAKKLPAPFHLELKNGALVMILVNDRAGRFVNGTTGIVKKINEEKQSIDVQLIDGNIVSITQYTWESENIEWNKETKKIERYVDGHFVQYPLVLAWAITTHKSQGRTLPKVQIEYSNSAFAPGQMYVALSRTRSVKDLFLLRQLKKDDFPRDVRLNAWIGENYGAAEKR